MRAFWERRALTVGVLSVLVMCPVAARANGHRDRGAVLAPTAYVETIPTVYAPTAYVLPTAYVDSTAYVATSWVQPGVYATSYVLPSYYATVGTVYAPTSYVIPAAYYPSSVVVPTAYTATAGCCLPDPCCASGGSAPSVVRSNVEASPAAGKATPPAADAGLKPLPSTVDSTPGTAGDEPAPLPTKLRESTPLPPAVGNTTPAAADPGVPSPPAAPAPEKDPGPGAVTPITPVVPEPGKEIKTPPVAPGGGGIELAPKGSEEVLREARRPVYTASTTAARAAQVGTSHVLEGKVVRQGTQTPINGVRITLSDSSGVRSDLVTESDSRGYYAIHLPDGEWTVKVPSRSGKTYTVSKLTVGNGQIIDQAGREVPTLLIQR